MVTISMNDLPMPDEEALRHSDRLKARIIEAINCSGSIGFDEYMRLALYEPGLGYYSSGSEKIGKSGDFMTAPEISDLYSRCLARQTAEILGVLSKGCVLEIGPGTAAMAEAMINELARIKTLPDEYLLLETSADLRQRQQQRLSESLPYYDHRLRWLSDLPTEPLTGVIIGNEVLDALPFSRLRYSGGRFREMAVSHEDGRLIWRDRELDEKKQSFVNQVLMGQERNFNEGYITEINFMLPFWLQSVARVLEKGVILLIDYGYPRGEYYHPQRDAGTLLCHYRHIAHHDPFLFPGLQDITASVDFTSVADVALDAGLTVAGYTTQAHFLMGTGLLNMMEIDSQPDTAHTAERARQVRQLTMPGEMGERFKVIALGKGFHTSMTGFEEFDQRYRL